VRGAWSAAASTCTSVPELAGELFATADLKGAVRSFLEQGPGHAT
jgi:enoyl-CoA hydratase